MSNKSFASALLVAVLAGCGTSPVVKSTIDSEVVSGEQIVGVYFLPERLVRVRLVFNGEGALVLPPKEETAKGPLTEVTVHGQAVRVALTSGNSYSDAVKIETSGGFLSKVTVTSEDQRPSTIKAIADAIPNLVAPIGKPAGMAATPGLRQSLRANRTVDVLVDPLATARHASMNGPLSPAGFNAAFAHYKLRLDLARLGSGAAAPGFELQRITHSGVIIPVAHHYRLSLHVDADGKDQANELLTLDTLVPSKTEFVPLDVLRTAWVKHETTLEFDDGIFKSADVKRGSVVAAAARLPLDVVRAIVSVPAEIVQFRVNHLSGSKETIAAQQALVDAERALLEARQKLLEQEQKDPDDENDAPGE